jgi:hypothetical protein
LTETFGGLKAFLGMGEDKAQANGSKRLLLRFQFPTHEQTEEKNK